MVDIELTPEEVSALAPFYFDAALQRRLRRDFLSGALSRERNRLHGRIHLPEPGMVRELPAEASAEGQAAMDAGLAAVSRGHVGLVILNGGMATRFGGGVKGIVPVVGDISFLGLKLTAARLLAERGHGEVPVYLMNSMATHALSLRYLEEQDFFGYPRELVTCFLQNTLVRLTPDGGLFRLDNGSLSPYGPGHGDLAEAMQRSVFPDMMARGVTVLQMSNVDNVLATPDPLLLGLHLVGGAEMTVEVVENRGHDTGGGPLLVDGKLQVVEWFRLPDTMSASFYHDFNANTFYFSPSCLFRDIPLSWFVVRKQVEDREAIQFERLAGQLSATLDCQCVRVPREGPASRFSPIKDRQTLERERERIATTLVERGFLSG